MKILKTIIGTAAFLALSTTAYAVPTLQIDVTNGSYDPAAEDLVCPSSTCEVLALLTPEPQKNRTDAEYEAYLSALLSETYYLAIALTPKTSTSGDYGSFFLNGTSYDVTADMTYGVPPLEANAYFDAGDLQHADIYETYFTEIGFTFDATKQCAKYDSAANPGGCDTSGTGSYYVAFTIDAAALADSFGLHFDLYNTVAKEGGDIDRDDFAPFSHDGRCCDRKVPEPGTLALLGIGLLGLGLTRRRRLEI